MTAEDRLINARREGAPLPLTRGTATGTAQGWLVESQRRVKDQQHMLCVRITHPDSRRLTMVFDGNSSDTNARTPINARLTPVITQVFRAQRSAESEAKTVAALERVFDAGWAAAEFEWAGPEALRVLQAAALGIPVSTLEQWQQALWDALPPAWVPAEAERRDAPARSVFLLMDSGLTVTQIAKWFTFSDLNCLSVQEVRAAAAFERAGWTQDETKALGEVLREHQELQPHHRGAAVPAEWARLTLDQARLGAQAGLSASETDRLLRSRGQQSLVTLAALRSGGALPVTAA